MGRLAGCRRKHKEPASEPRQADTDRENRDCGKRGGAWRSKRPVAPKQQIEQEAAAQDEPEAGANQDGREEKHRGRNHSGASITADIESVNIRPTGTRQLSAEMMPATGLGVQARPGAGENCPRREAL